MKNYSTLFLFLIFNIFLIHSQNNLGPSSEFFANKSTGSLSNTVNTTDYPVLTFFDKSRVFNNKFDDTRRKGSYFLFKKWDNDGEVLIQGKKFTLTNVNYDIEDDKFMSKVNGDSILVFDSNYVEAVRINGKVFKYLYDFSMGKKRNFEVVYEVNNDFAILKGYSLKVILSDPNPMLNRPLDEIKQRNHYFVLKNEGLSELRLQKKEILKLIDKEKMEEVKEFVNKRKLSFKQEKDIVSIFKYYDTL